MEGMVLGFIKKESDKNVIICLEPQGECGIYKISSLNDFVGIDIFDKINFKLNKNKLIEIEKRGFTGIKNMMSSMRFNNQALKFISSKKEKNMIVLIEDAKRIYKENDLFILEFKYKGKIEQCNICDIGVVKYLDTSAENMAMLNIYINNSYTILVLEERRGRNEILKIQNIKMEIDK